MRQFSSFLEEGQKGRHDNSRMIPASCRSKWTCDGNFAGTLIESLSFDTVHSDSVRLTTCCAEAKVASHSAGANLFSNIIINLSNPLISENGSQI